MTTTKYNLTDFERISFNGFDFSIPEETINLISKLSMEVGSPTYIKTPVFQKKNNENNIFSPSSSQNRSSNGVTNNNSMRKKRNNRNNEPENWESLRTFQITNIEQHVGVEAQIDKIRSCLNKLTDKTYNDMKTQVIEILHENISNEDMYRIGNIIFDIASNNKFYSKLYSDIFTELINSFEIMKDVFNVNYKTYLGLFDNIEYVDSEKDYNKFCLINKQNENRRAISTFFINLSLNDVIDTKEILTILKRLLESVLTKIKLEDNKNEVDELTENIAILFDKRIIQKFEEENHLSLKDYEDLFINGSTVVETIKQLSEIKVKSYPSMSSKTIFKFMDMI